MDLENFVDKFDEFGHWPASKQVDYISYYLTSEKSYESVKAGDISQCFRRLDLREYKRISQYLSENSTGQSSKYVKHKNGGYRLERGLFTTIERQVKNEPIKVHVSTSLMELIDKLADANEKIFLIEAINCYRVEAYRATIIMTWVASIDHLQRFVFAQKLNEFNAALAKNPDKKVSKIINYDDFSDLPEVKFIELLRSAGIISNDVRKILDEKLGIRNSAAHPSGVSVNGHKATEFILDLLTNVLLKY